MRGFRELRLEEFKSAMQCSTGMVGERVRLHTHRVGLYHV